MNANLPVASYIDEWIEIAGRIIVKTEKSSSLYTN